MAKGKKGKISGIEPFEDEVNDEVDDDNDNGEEVMATKNKKGSSRRQRIEAEAENDEDEVETDGEEEDDEDADEPEAEADDDEDDDEDAEDEEAEPVDLGFAPYVIHEDADWELVEVIDAAEPGENIYFFAPPDPENETPAKWYKLASIEVGELGK